MTCDLDVVDHDGVTALCRFMYTGYGFAIPTMYDGGPRLHYCAIASALWGRIEEWQEGARGPRSWKLGGWPSSVNATEMSKVWCYLVRTLPLVEEWPFSTRCTRYPTSLMGHFYESKVRKNEVKLSLHVWP